MPKCIPQLSADPAADAAIEKGWLYYRERLFTSDLTPKYYDDRVDPLTRLRAQRRLSRYVTSTTWTQRCVLRNMQSLVWGCGDGSFAYQRRRKAHGADTVPEMVNVVDVLRAQ